MSLHLTENRLILWTVRVLSFCALCISLFLLTMKLTGRITSWGGCGGEGGCADVLGGRWSQWFGIPVTALAAGAYSIVLILTLPAVMSSPGRTADQLLTTLAWILILAATWFIGLLVFSEKTLCLWCLTLHGLGVGTAFIILIKASRSAVLGEGRLLGSAAMSGITAIVVIILGQLFGPQPVRHQITNEAPMGEFSGLSPSSEVVTRTVTFFGKSSNPLKFDLKANPLLGSADAPHVIAEYFDYTCRSCRDLYGDLAKLKEKWPSQFAVILLPTPLNRKCNPWLRSSVTDHAKACELARLALAVWLTQPDKFLEYHDFLMKLTLPVTSDSEARLKATELIGEAALTAVFKEGRLAQFLEANVTAYSILAATNNRMPKLLIRDDTVMHGTASSSEVFLEEMASQFQLAIPSPIPVMSPGK